VNNYLGGSDTVALVAPAAGTVSGAPFLIGRNLVVPVTTQASGEQVTAATEGIFKIAKVSAAITNTPHVAAEAWTLGQDLYWDSTNSVLTPKAIGPKVAVCTVAAGSSDTVGECMLTPERSGLQVVSAVFSVGAGKAIGTHELVGGSLPAGAVIVSRDYYVITTFTSATDAGTIALGITTQDDDALKAAVAISNGANPYDVGAFLPSAPVAAVLTTAARTLCAVVAIEALTAGKLVVNVVYHVPAIAA
jgi:predicted RecA/RadA family phage recombinase